jgi:hypothetical protein
MGHFVSMIHHNHSSFLIYMSTFEIYSQCEMLPKDSTNNLSAKSQIATRVVESVDMAIRAAWQMPR